MSSAIYQEKNSHETTPKSMSPMKYLPDRKSWDGGVLFFYLFMKR